MNSAAAPSDKLIDIQPLLHRAPVPGLSTLATPLEALLAVGRINRCYRRFLAEMAGADGFAPQDAFDLALKVLGVQSTLAPEDGKRIPSSGPLVVVGNHPYGGIEGVILAAMLLKVRKDVRVLGNYLLRRIEGIREYIIAVDPFGGGAGTASANLKGMKEALTWVKNGGALLTFPAGEVSSFQLRRGRVSDPPWSPHVAGIIRRCRATALPVYLPGRNSLMFQVLGTIHPRLRTTLLARELVNKAGKRIEVVVGQPLGWSKMARFSTDEDRIEYLRFVAYVMQNRHRAEKKRVRLAGPIAAGRFQKPVVAAVDARRLEKEVAALPAESRLAEHGDLFVQIARAEQIPALLQEIGRLREITFREVGEGTGDAIDLDRFDRYYRHLFLWNRRKKELVGAYRLGLTDQILAEHGTEGLYTSRLFRFKPAFVGRLESAIEFGRSFIRSEYQRQFSSLMLLWKGIGAFIARRPRYHVLFGAVSISRDYQAVSRNLMVRFLKERRFDPALSRLVSPRKPYRARRVVGVRQHILDTSFQDLDDVSLLVSEVEKDGKGIPVLLRQYLKLNGRLLCFNVDRAFSDVVDGLLMVDLRYTGARLMKRFMGDEGYRRFVALHGAAETPAPAADNWRETA